MAAKKSTAKPAPSQHLPLRLVASWSAGGGVLTLSRPSESAVPPTLFPDEELLARVEHDYPARPQQQRRKR